MTHDELKALLPAYSLQALPEDEAALVEAHLEGCPECSLEADGLGDLAESLALAVTPQAPPAGFADRVVERATGGTAPERSHGSRRRWWAVAIATVVIAAVVAGAVELVTTTSSANRLKTAVATLSRNDGMALEGDDGVVARMVGDEDGSTFAVAGLDPAAEGKTYELWLMRGNDCPSTDPSACEIAPAGTFDIEDRVGLLEIDDDVSRWDIVAVTVERDGGVDAPTGDPILISSS